ncbi:hypothetical protein HYT54_00050 [Candidatus Woesearchaeota archaeon]|nr:hypothetical protein [Candidatus Woesearchaeota archaeon]
MQKTGNMHYIYLPTSWCREHKISNSSKVSIEQGGSGELRVVPNLKEKEPKRLKLNISEHDQDIIHKLAVACYINPLASFEINFDREMDYTKLLKQKRLINLESVELDKKQITCESTVSISNPDSLLKTMVKKIKNMITVMQIGYDAEVISRYEDEIDRSKMLIDKSIISSLAFQKSTDLKTIDLYYISLISKELERMVDHLIQLKPDQKEFLNSLHEPIAHLQKILENTKALNHKSAIQFIRICLKIRNYSRDISTYDHERIRLYLLNISEVLMDWAITNELEGI